MLAHRLLAHDLPQRWDHVQGVARRAELFVDVVPGWEALVPAAYLHDIGYAAEAVDIGYHQIDGARYLRKHGCDEAIVNLVAHHSGARIRAEFTGLTDIYASEFIYDDTLPHRQLQFCDMTTALDGSPTTVGDRIADMRRRHHDNPSMLEFLDAQEQAIIGLVTETWQALERADDDRGGQRVSAS